MSQAIFGINLGALATGPIDTGRRREAHARGFGRLNGGVSFSPAIQLANRQDRTASMANDKFRGAPQDKAFQSRATMSGNNNQINAQLVCSVDDGVSGMTGFDDGCDLEPCGN